MYALSAFRQIPRQSQGPTAVHMLLVFRQILSHPRVLQLMSLCNLCACAVFFSLSTTSISKEGLYNPPSLHILSISLQCVFIVYCGLLSPLLNYTVHQCNLKSSCKDYLSREKVRPGDSRASYCIFTNIPTSV